MQDTDVLAFSDFRLQVAPAALYRRGRPVRLQAQPLRLLALLASRSGELVTHRDIQRHLWHDHVVDFAGGTHVCMRQIRSALGEDAGEPRYIETVARHGYRFVAPVRRVSPDEVAMPPDGPAAEPERRSRLRVAAALPVILAVAAVLGSSFHAGEPPEPEPPEMPPQARQAQRLYDSARQLANYDQFDRQQLAVRLLQRTLAIDPDHGAANALLADLITQHGAEELGIEAARDDELVEHHLRLASRHGADASDVLVTRGRQLLYAHRRIAGALDAFERAIAANPANAAAWQLQAEALYLLGRYEQALEASRRAEALAADPAGVLWDRLQIYYLAGRFDELFALYERVRHTQKTGAITIGVAMELVGRRVEAFDFIVDALRHRGILIGDATGARQRLAAGSAAEAYQWLLAEIRGNEDPPVGGKAIAILQTLAGERAAAAATLRAYVRSFERMEQGRHLDCLCFLTLRQDPFFARIDDEPLVQEAWVALESTIDRGVWPAATVTERRRPKAQTAVVPPRQA